MLPLVATLAVFKTTLDSHSVALKDNEQVTKAGNYLAKWIATMAAPGNNACRVALYDAILHGK